MTFETLHQNYLDAKRQGRKTRSKPLTAVVSCTNARATGFLKRNLVMPVTSVRMLELKAKVSLLDADVTLIYG